MARLVRQQLSSVDETRLARQRKTHDLTGRKLRRKRKAARSARRNNR